MFALATTINSQFSSMTKPMLQASVDGWLPKAVPKAWENSKFKISRPVLSLVTGISVLTVIVTIVLLASSSTPAMLIGNAAILVFSVLYCLYRLKSGKVKMEISYEDN
jgi:APA family basic amino acid/polyamine antiporter